MPAGEALIGPVGPPDLSIMTWNVRRARKASADWMRRRDRLTAVLRREQPTILGAQEVLAHQASVLRAGLGDPYLFVGHGRDADGGGEGCPIFYDARRMELLDWQQITLSEHPDAAGSRSWGALFPRILTRADFADRASGLRFTAVNTHLDVLSPLARRRAAALVAAQHLTREWATYARRRRPRSGGRRIDAIHTRGCDVLRAGIDARPTGGGWASDHLPVQAVIRMRDVG